MKKSIIKFFDKSVILLLGIAGTFTGCKPVSDYSCEYIGDHGFMYGPPVANYAIKGTVRDQENSKPIPNIQITRQVTENYGDTLYTDSKGNYIYQFYNYSENSGNSICLKFEDIDGKENGGDFTTKEMEIKFTDAEIEKIEKCHKEAGRFVKTQNIQLKKK